MRGRVKVVIYDETGNILSQLAPHQIDLGIQSLHEIEGAVETWRQEALPEIEADLLSQAHAPVHATEKRTESLAVTARG